MDKFYIIIIIIILLFFYLNNQKQLIKYSDDILMAGLFLEPMNNTYINKIDSANNKIEPMINNNESMVNIINNEPMVNITNTWYNVINRTYDDNNQPNINDDNIQHNYSFRRDRYGLGNSRGFEPKYIHENENQNYINQFDKSKEKQNIDPLYKENKIISNDKLFITDNNSNIIPLFLTSNDYNIMKGNLNKIIIDPIL
jgi:hypothetical protein